MTIMTKFYVKSEAVAFLKGEAKEK